MANTDSRLNARWPFFVSQAIAYISSASNAQEQTRISKTLPSRVHADGGLGRVQAFGSWHDRQAAFLANTSLPSATPPSIRPRSVPVRPSGVSVLSPLSVQPPSRLVCRNALLVNGTRSFRRFRCCRPHVIFDWFPTLFCTGNSFGGLQHHIGRDLPAVRASAALACPAPATSLQHSPEGGVFCRQRRLVHPGPAPESPRRGRCWPTLGLLPPGRPPTSLLGLEAARAATRRPFGQWATKRGRQACRGSKLTRWATYPGKRSLIWPRLCRFDASVRCGPKRATKMPLGAPVGVTDSGKSAGRGYGNRWF